SRPASVNRKNWRFDPNSGNLSVTYHFKLGPTQSPKTWDQQSQYKERPVLPKVELAIYKLEGDTLTICYIGYYDKGKRPAEFKAAKGSDRRVYVLKRENP